MCKLVYVDALTVVDEDTLERCSGICLDNLFNRINRKILDFKQSGYEFKIEYVMERRGLLGTDYEYKSIIQDFGDTGDVFGVRKSATIESFKDKFLGDLECLFDQYKGRGRDMTSCTIKMENYIGSKAHFEYYFDAVLSYAYYMYFTKRQKKYKKYMDVVHETWEGFRNWNDANYLPELWVPKKPTGKRPKRIGDML